MPNRDRDVEKQDIYDIDLVMLIEMGIFSDLRNKNIRFNPKPFKDPKGNTFSLDFFNIIEKIKGLKNKQIRFKGIDFTPPKILKKETQEKTNDFIDLHLEIVKKVDELINSNETETQTKNLEPETTTIQKNETLPEFIEIREQIIKPPEISVFKTELGQINDICETFSQEDIFEIVPPQKLKTENQTTETQDENMHSWMIGREEKKSQKRFMGLGRIKIKGNKKTVKKTQINKKPKTKINGVAKSKEELEKTKKEIEAKKQELERAKQKEKEKEEEFKRKLKEKQEKEKKRKEEMKKKQKEKKLREKKEKKEQLKKEKELKRLEKKEKEEKINKKKQKAKKQEKEKPKKEKKKFNLKFKKEKKVVKSKVKKEKPPEMKEFISKKEKKVLDNDVEKLLPIIDELLEKLPEDVIDEFAQSKKFELYEKVMTKYKK